MKKLVFSFLSVLIAITMFCSSAIPGTQFLTKVSAENAYTLQWNVQVGNWKDEYIYYNCYAYALGLTDKFYSPGEFEYGASTFSYTDTIEEIANDVKADLKSTGESGLNNKCVKMITVCPTSVPAGYSCICVRKGAECANPARTDFHFMRYNGSDWYHKPSISNPLKYIGEISASVPWYGEVSISNVPRQNPVNYTGTIYYFIYNSQHLNTTYAMTGKNYHSGSNHYYEYRYKCDNCREFTGDSTWDSVPCRGGNYCIEPFDFRDEHIAA